MARRGGDACVRGDRDERRRGGPQRDGRGRRAVSSSELLERRRQPRGDGAQADLRLSVGVFRYGPVGIGVFVHETWANAKAMDTLKNDIVKLADHRLFVTKDNFAVFGESTRYGRLTRNCYESIPTTSC